MIKRNRNARKKFCEKRNENPQLKLSMRHHEIEFLQTSFASCLSVLNFSVAIWSYILDLSIY